MIKIIFTAALFITAILSNAQTFCLGPSAGFGYSHIENFPGDKKFHSSWNAGLSFIKRIKPHFSIGADIKFLSQGDKIQSTIIGPADGLINYTHTVNLNYIYLPVKLIYLFGTDKNIIRPKIYVGPDFGFLAGGKSVVDYSGNKMKTDLQNGVKNFDLAGIIAAGFNLKLTSTSSLNFDLSYYNGFKNISKFNNPINVMVEQINILATANKCYNRNLQLNMGLLLNLKKIKQ